MIQVGLALITYLLAIVSVLAVSKQAPKSLGFQGYLKEREYLIKAEDESTRQLDQLIFYTSSAAIGLSITQVGSVKSYPELALLLLACISFILTIRATYFALHSSAKAFEACRVDADRAQTIPYETSEPTKIIENMILRHEKEQSIFFRTALILLVLFVLMRGGQLIGLNYYLLPAPITPIIKNECKEVIDRMTEKEERIRETTIRPKPTDLHEHAVKPKPPPPIKPEETKPSQSSTEKK